MKQIIMTAEVSGLPKYSVSCCTHDALYQKNIRPEHAAKYWVLGFIGSVAGMDVFRNSKVTFTLTTHKGAHLYRFAQYINPKSEEDLAKFWIPVVTKYISEN